MRAAVGPGERPQVERSVVLRGQFARVGIRDAENLNDAVFRQTGVSPNIARALQGSYLEASYRVIARAAGEVGTFVRYENVDTQFRMPDGFTPLKAFDRDAWVVGATYWPDPDVALKVDYVQGFGIDQPRALT